LEARWAVFFDALKIKWEYEPEGYELPDGMWYLPDFWLARLGAWLEIKPGGHVALGDSEARRAQGLADTTKKQVFIFGQLEANAVPSGVPFFPGAPRVCWPEGWHAFFSESHPDPKTGGRMARTKGGGDFAYYCWDECHRQFGKLTAESDCMDFRERLKDLMRYYGAVRVWEALHAADHANIRGSGLIAWLEGALPDRNLVFKPGAIFILICPKEHSVFSRRIADAVTVARSARFEHGEEG
jgi:hypothetical protein